MGLLAMAKAKAKASSTPTTTSSSSNNNQSGMSFLLVFFPQENNNTISPTSISTTTSTLKRTNSNNLILSKAQFTISICALLLFFTLLLFTLSTFEPTISNITPTPRRSLLHKPPSHTHTTKSKPQQKNWSLPKLFQQPNKSLYLTSSNNDHHHPSQYALQRMGILHRRGTRSMTDLIICHVADETAHHDFRLFLRLVHRSGLTAKSDVVFIFSSLASSSAFSDVISEENSAFFSLISLQTEPGRRSAQITKSQSSFDLARFYSAKKAEVVEPLWGKRIRSNLSNVERRGGEGEGGINNGGGELELSYGSVVSFDATELDPENSLAGFLDRVPLSLRRWACYPMLLGRVRRNFKHVMLVDVKNTIILKDPLGRVRNRSPESVFLFSKKNSDKTRSTQRRVNSGVIIGGARGVRRLCNAVLVEIVREAMQQQNKKKKNSVSDSVILSQLVGSEFMWKNNNNVNFVSTTESIPEASSLGGHNSGTAATSSLLNHAIIQRGGGNHDLSTVIKKEIICSSLVDSSVYRDC
ncbi:hypothetical protein RIF29_39369 [Crotalaria pallida]|uniref:DUF7780 domain-containing protein n=1 Tax=Crotalaria pallida TaxID=3830 RepID=A0AAN9HMF0_CROPI